MEKLSKVVWSWAFRWSNKAALGWAWTEDGFLKCEEVCNPLEAMEEAVQEAETGTEGEGRIEVMNYEGNISEIGKKLVRAANLNKNLTSSIPQQKSPSCGSLGENTVTRRTPCETQTLAN